MALTLATRGRGSDKTANGPLRYTGIMTREEVNEVLDRVLDWPAEDQAKLVGFVRELEQWREDEVIIDEAREQARSQQPSV
jgi:ribosomal 50S subunit-associated protein YjgA (DUF615 family)